MGSSTDTFESLFKKDHEPGCHPENNVAGRVYIELEICVGARW